MSHVRQQIREAAAALVTGLATTSTRVFQSRIHPLRDADLPCLLVSTDDEQIETLGINHNAMQERTLQLVIKGVSKQSANLDDTLDAMLAEVEAALADQTLGGIVKDLRLESLRVEMSDDIDKPVGIAAAHYQVTYYTATGSPGTAQ